MCFSPASAPGIETDALVDDFAYRGAHGWIIVRLTYTRPCAFSHISTIGCEYVYQRGKEKSMASGVLILMWTACFNSGDVFCLLKI